MGDENIFRIPEVKEKRSNRRLSLNSAFELPFTSKRKRKTDEDSLSVQSYDVGATLKKKTRRSLLRVSSLVNLLSPSKSSKTRSRTPFKVPCSPRPVVSPYKAPLPSAGKKRLGKTWSDMMTTDGRNPSKFSHNDIKKQEAIYELCQGEQDMIDDLNIVQKTYHDSMQKLQLMSHGELKQIFGPIESLLPVHRELSERLLSKRQADGTTQEVGRQLLEWLPLLKCYIPFCSNQVFGKALFDEKKNDPAVVDFLQRCQDSPFSRKLDLWSLLDGVRSKFMKYPLLIKSIQKYTDPKDVDYQYLTESIKLIESVVASADKSTGEAKCCLYKARISYIYDDQKHSYIEDSTNLVCNGILRNNKGSKLHIFLFNKILLVTRLTNQNGQQCYQVYRQPIPVDEMIIEDMKEVEIKMGSFRKSFSQTATTPNSVFKVSFKDPLSGQSHTLIANDEHDKRQWLQCLEKLLADVPKCDQN
ncbi:neuroepithelial cell-transforming gene 1 protein [Patella vulgata]|uniref:neuroepithelial cell-transforming gene 1 protein n=1 Tax=Patella vulgata TaxID=6465 RepID=UPI0021803EC0|nr:neuroepithelial cell-transforming gene 1 protein [Patella vulgata]